MPASREAGSRCLAQAEFAANPADFLALPRASPKYQFVACCRIALRTFRVELDLAAGGAAPAGKTSYLCLLAGMLHTEHFVFEAHQITMPITDYAVSRQDYFSLN